MHQRLKEQEEFWQPGNEYPVMTMHYVNHIPAALFQLNKKWTVTTVTITIRKTQSVNKH